MNRSYIKEMCDAFYKDYALFENADILPREQLLVEMERELNATMDNLYLEDLEVYNQIFEFDRGTQQKIIYDLLNEYMKENYDVDVKYGDIDPELINEIDISGGWITGAALAIAGAIIGWGVISRTAWNAASILNKASNKINELVAELTKSGRVKRAVFNVNIEQCMRKCGIAKKSDISNFVGMAMSGTFVVSRNAQKQATCLAHCYLVWMTNNIEMLASGYARCLRLSGASADSDLSSTNVFISAVPSMECKAYYEALEEHYNAFKDAVDIFTKTTDKSKQEIMASYNKALDTGLKDGYRQHASANRANKMHGPRNNNRR